MAAGGVAGALSGVDDTAEKPLQRQAQFAVCGPPSSFHVLVYAGFGLVPLGSRHYLTDHLANIVLNAFEERLKLRGAALDTPQVRLPLARHRRALYLGVHDLDQPDALVRGFQTLAFADDVFALQQHLDDRRAGGGVPRPVSFIASESSFSSSVFPAVSIAVSSVASVKRLGAGSFSSRLHVHHVLALTCLQDPAEAVCFGGVGLLRPAFASVSSARARRPAPSSPPAERRCRTCDTCRRASPFVIAVITVVTDQTWSSCQALSKTAANEIVDLALIFGQCALCRAKWVSG